MAAGDDGKAGDKLRKQFESASEVLQRLSRPSYKACCSFYHMWGFAGHLQASGISTGRTGKGVGLQLRMPQELKNDSESLLCLSLLGQRTMQGCQN
jgi:hypothetical protein